MSLFATGGDAEFDATNVKGLEFIAVLRSAAPNVMVVDLQGLVISCSGSTDPAVPVIEPLPSDIRPLTIDEIAEEVRATQATPGDSASGIVRPVDSPARFFLEGFVFLHPVSYTHLTLPTTPYV